jgi:hypothetical protein
MVKSHVNEFFFVPLISKPTREVERSHSSAEIIARMSRMGINWFRIGSFELEWNQKTKSFAWLMKILTNFVAVSPEKCAKMSSALVIDRSFLSRRWHWSFFAPANSYIIFEFEAHFFVCHAVEMLHLVVRRNHTQWTLWLCVRSTPIMIAAHPNVTLDSRRLRPIMGKIDHWASLFIQMAATAINLKIVNEPISI